MRIASLHVGHDASASFYDGSSVRYFLEERYSHVKHDQRYDYCLKKLFNLNIKFDLLVISSFDNSVLNSLTDNSQFKKFLSDYNERWGEYPRFIFDHSHHRHHSSLAFYNSGFDKSLVIVVDGSGQNEGSLRECESVYIAEYPNNFTPIYKNYLITDHSNYEKDLEKLKKKYPGCSITARSKIGISAMYGSCASHFGESDLSAGKVMGLQSYGKEESSHFILDEIYVDDSDFYVDYNLIRVYNKNIPTTNKVTKENFKIYSDYARTLQVQAELMMESLIKKYVEKTTIKNVCISGGYGMNIISNYKFIKSFPDINFYNEPLSTDCGISLGSCFFYYRDKTSDMTVKPIASPYFHGMDS